jgi:hypothetical protein
MIKINYMQFLREETEFDPDAKVVGKGSAFKRSELGVTVVTHDGTHLQFMRHEPGSLRVQEWIPNAANQGKILKGAPKVLPTHEAFKLAGNRAIPEHQTTVPDFFKSIETAGYREYFRNRESRETGSE